MPRNNQYNKAKGVADIVFLIDATGSMECCIKGLKENLNAFFTVLTNASANNGYAINDWRAKVVGFRDIEWNEAPWLENNSFVRDVDQLRSQLAHLKTGNGVDWPESLLDALYFVIQMGETEQGSEDPEKWRKTKEAARVVVVFTDAEYKPVMRVKGAEGGTVEDVVNCINGQKIKLFLFAPDEPCYEELSRANSVEFQPVSGSGLDEVTKDPAVFEKLLKQLAATISISQSYEL